MGPRSCRARSSRTPVNPLGIGDAKAFTLHEFASGVDPEWQSVKVNVASGNLLVQRKLAEIEGPGYAPQVRAVYNSRSQEVYDSPSERWLVDLVNVALESAAGDILFHDPDGVVWRFEEPQDQGEHGRVAAGLDARLVDGVVIHNRTGERMDLWAPREHADRNGVGVTFEQDEYGYVTGIRHSSGRSLEFWYGVPRFRGRTRRIRESHRRGSMAPRPRS